MAWSYNRLWVMLIYKGVKRTHLIELAGLNAAALAKMGKNETVSMDMMTPAGYAKMFLFVLIGYLIVLLFDFRRIKRIPLNEALKNAE